MKHAQQETRSSPPRRGVLTRLAILIIGVGLYGAVFWLAYWYTGSGIAAVTAIPVVLLGWLFGIFGGVLAALVFFVVNMMLLSWIGGQPLIAVILSGGNLTGGLVLLIIGGSAGWLSRLQTQYINELRERKKIEEALQQRIKYDRSLLQLSKQFELAQDFQEVIQPVQAEVHKILGYSNVWVYLSKGNDELKLLTGAGKVTSQVGSEHTTLHIKGDQFLEEVWNSKEVHVVLDAQTDPRTNKEIVTQLGNRTIINVPMIIRGQFLGFLGTGSFWEEGIRPPEPDQLEYLSGLASHIAVAISRIQLLAELEQRVHFTALLNSITRSAFEATDLAAVLQQVVDRLVELFHADTCYLTLWDEETQRPIPAAATGPEKESYKFIVPKPEELTLTESALQAEHALVIEDKFRSPYMSTHIAGIFPHTSALALPLIAGQQKLGAIVLGYTQARTFPISEVILAEQAAAQVALAIAKTQLLDETNRRANLFSRLYETAKILDSQDDLSSVLLQVVENARELLGVSTGGLYLYDAETDILEIKISTNATMPLGIRLKMGEGMAGRVAQTRTSMRLDDYQTWPLRSSKYDEIPVRATAQVPLLYSGELVGVLAVHEVGENTRKFTEADVRLLALFASQAAGAIYNTRLLEETRKRANIFATLYEIAQNLTLEQDNELLLKTLVQKAVDLLNSSGGGLYLYDPLRNDLEVKVTVGSSIAPGTRFRMGEGMAGRVAQSRKPLIVADYQTWEHRSLQYEGEPIRSTVEVPLLYHGDLIGVLAVHEIGENNRIFTEADARMLSLLAGQAAGVIYNAHLLDVERQRRTEAETLRQVTMTLSGTLNKDHALELILSQLDFVIPYDSAHITLIEDNFLLPIAYRGFRFAGQEKISLQVDQYPHLEKAIQERRPVIIANTRRDPHWVIFPGVEYVQCWMGVPLLVKDRVIGLLHLDKTEPDFYTQEHADLAMIFASQAAVTIENARLFAETLQRQSELEILLNISQTVSSSLELQQVLQKVALSMSQLLRMEWSAISLYDPNTNTLQTEVEYSVDQGFEVEDYGTRYDLSMFPTSAWVIMQNQPQIIRLNDPETDLNERNLLKSLEVSCALLLPIVAAGQTVGLAELYTADESRNFTQEEIRLAQALADQAAIAISNAQLYAETRHRLAELEAINHLSKALREAHSMEDTYTALLQQINALFSTAVSSIWLYQIAEDKLHQKVATSWFAQIDEPEIEIGEGIAGYVFQTGEIYITHEFSSDPKTRQSARSQVPSGWGGACFPLRTGQITIGVFFVSVPLPHELRPEQINLLATMAEIAGNAIHRTQLNDQIRRQLQRLMGLRSIDAAISSSLDLHLTLNILLEHVLSELDVDAASVLLLDPHTFKLNYAAARGFRTTNLRAYQQSVDQGLAGQVAGTRNPILIPDLSQHTDFLRASMLRGEGFIFYSGVPLIAKGQVKGVLEVFQRAPLSVPSDWLDFLDALAAQAAIAIDNAELFDSLQRSNLEITLAYDSTLEGWVGMLDLRDKETEGHTKRVTEMTIRLARKMHLPEEELVHIRRGALLHDIGKLAIPDRILLKTGPLIPEEWDTMRLHPQYAYNMLSRIAFLRPALDIPYCHHEKWDGSGYPRGLKGLDIPLSARIFSVVDVWDALTSDRPYRKAWSKADARAYLLEQSGKHFDPEVVRYFLPMLDIS